MILMGSVSLLANYSVSVDAQDPSLPPTSLCWSMKEVGPSFGSGWAKPSPYGEALRLNEEPEISAP